MVLDELPDPTQRPQAHRGELLAARPPALLRGHARHELRRPEGRRQRIAHLMGDEAQVVAPGVAAGRRGAVARLPVTALHACLDPPACPGAPRLRPYSLG